MRDVVLINYQMLLYQEDFVQKQKKNGNFLGKKMDN